MVGLLLAGPASDLLGSKAPMAAAIAIRVAVFASGVALVCTLLIREERHTVRTTKPSLELAATGDVVG